ncbi:sporulation membrane protein YtrI [Fredinandcohnia onubensis]|uniref:sporulation membrane protein YtrI n=1 Tax=Fredinandcohnia onubensis TaxID=1571209 RepID=UPI00115687E3|nr:sporulation membrane protein YtrI [Fredinandcohnia onubensis]
MVHPGAYLIMRVPPYHEKPGWQRFFAGVVIGALISWFVFLFQFGVLQDKQIQKISEQELEISDLKKSKEILIEDAKKLNEENKSKLKIQDFEIVFANRKKVELSSLDLHHMKTAVLEDLNSLIGQDIQSLSKNKDLLFRTIENRLYEMDDKTYKLKIHTVFVDTTLEISLNIELVN